MTEDKVKEKMLADLKRSNKERKLYLAKKYGFEDMEEYKAYLEGKEAKFENKSKVNSKVLTDIVIAFDTTGSMASYIGAVKQHVKDLIPQLFANTDNVKISIVAFGDYCDMKSMTEFGKAYQVIDLTDNSNKLIDFVSRAKNTSGGDSPEFYGLVLHKILNETSWRKGANKSVLFIADDIDHEIGRCSSGYTNKYNWAVEAPLYKEAGVKVDTLSIHGHYWYQQLSAITNGVYLKFSSSNKTADLLDGYAYARSGSTISFMATMDRVEKSGDSELIGVYKILSTL